VRSAGHESYYAQNAKCLLRFLRWDGDDSETAVIDAGTKVLTSDQYTLKGYGHLVEYPEAVITNLSEEHGIVDLSGCHERPKIGDVVNVVPNHCCVVSNMVDEVYGVRDGKVEVTWPVAARGTVR
jgi:D-serine deaminase-like pyridoxal phosphate-dependent protein